MCICGGWAIGVWVCPPGLGTISRRPSERIDDTPGTRQALGTPWFHHGMVSYPNRTRARPSKHMVPGHSAWSLPPNFKIASNYCPVAKLSYPILSFQLFNFDHMAPSPLISCLIMYPSIGICGLNPRHPQTNFAILVIDTVDISNPTPSSPLTIQHFA